MTKKLIVLFATLGLITGSISCTSTSSDSDTMSEVDDMTSLDAGEGGDDLLMGTESSEADLGITDDSGSSDALLTGESTDSLGGDESLVADDSGLETVTEVLPGDSSDSMASMDTSANAESATTLGEVPAPTEPETDWNAMSAGNEVALSETTTTTEYSTDASATSDSSASSDSSESMTSDVPKIGLQKMAAMPWKQGKTNYNTLYFAKPGNTLAGISQIIYGSDRTAELLKGNPTYQTREVRPGDKVYYQSPNRPTDDSKVITYYEDIGLVPEMYVAQGDEKLRDIASSTLGYKDGWKELWSTNDIESKSTVSAGTQLRFWKGSPAETNLAQNSMPSMPATSQPNESMQAEAAPAMPAETVPSLPEPDMNNQDPMAMAAADAASQADMDAQLGMNNSEMPGQASMDMPPPPPPPMEMAPPPPPPPMAAQAPPAMEESFEEEVPAMDSEMMMALGVIGAAAALLAGLMVIRKKKQREMEQALNETQVG